MGQVQGMIFPKQSWIDSWYTGVHWTPLLDVKDHVFYVFCSSPISWFFCRCCYFRKAHVVTNVQISEIEEGPKNPMNLMNFKNQSGKSTFSIHHFPHESFHFIFGGHNFPLCYIKPASPARPNLPKDCGRDRVPSEPWPGMLRWMGVTSARARSNFLPMSDFQWQYLEG